MIQPWRIRLLGTFEIRSGETVYYRCRTQKIEALLAYLAWHLGSSCSRETLADRLWVDSEPEAAMTNLRVALNALRDQLEPQGVIRGSIVRNDGRGRVSLNPEAVTCDVVDFRRLLKKKHGQSDEERRQDLLQALDLYTGELMPGHYEDIVEDERRQLAFEFMDALQELSDLLKDSQALDEAIRVARRAVQEDPYEEEAQYHLLKLLTLAGKHEEVLDRYQQLQKMQDEGEIGPPPEQYRVLFERARGAVARKEQAPVRLQEPPRRPAAPGRPPATPSVPAEPAAWSPLDHPAIARTAPTRRSTPPVPKPLTRFFGREEELAALDALARDPAVRLITITGVGGTGKTRLAVEYANRRVAEGFRNVAYVPMADLTAGDQIAPKIAGVLGMHVVSGTDILNQLEGYLADQEWLLILDNLEQVCTEAVPVLMRLLENVPGLRIIATSRHALEILGERQLPLEAFPVPMTPGTPERLMEFACVQLFLDRATGVAPGLRVTERNAADIARICRELEGLPLSIELAAGWAADLSPGQMVARLAQKFDLLVGRRAGLPPRQASLLASLEWSYRLLSPDLQRTFTVLSVFRGGWTLESFEAVCGVKNGLAAMSELRSRSLITSDATGEVTRYSMLEILREFAAEKLAESDRPFLANRHAAYFAEMAERARPHLRTGMQTEWLQRMWLEHDNLHAALEWLLNNNPTGGPAMAHNMFPYWTMRGHWKDARRLLDMASQNAERQGARAALAEMVCLSGAAALAEGDTRSALEQADRSVAMWRKIGDTRGLMVALNNQGLARCAAGDLDGARSAYEEGLALGGESEDEIVALLLTNYAVLHLLRRDFETAKALTQTALGLHRRRGDAWSAAVAAANLGDIACQEYNARAAWLRYAEALPGFVGAGDLVHASHVLRQLAAVAAYVGRYRDAALLAAAGASIQERSGRAPDPVAAKDFADTLEAIRSQLDEETFRRAWADGAGLSLHEAAAAVAAMEPPGIGEENPSEDR